MYLKTLTCKGFKSFADRVAMNLEPGITAIIGPNGSGKSNVLDAVLWVLGERNARNLRGQSMEDVIFAGSSTRRHVGMAEVNLVLDNSDGTLPVDYEEVSITRRLYRSGEGEYLINGTACRRMDVLDILHDTGLGTGTHSIISQGHLDGVLQSRPEDRRALIEEAAGVLKHKQRKARSERKLERMDAHLLRIRDVNREVERQLKPLERKAKRAATYQTLAGELAEVALDLAVDDLRTLQGRWDAACAAERELAALVATKGELAQQADAAVQALQSQLQQRTEDAGEAAESLRRVSRAAEQLDSTVMLLREKKRSSLRMLEEKRLQLEADTARLEASRQSLSSAEESLREVARQKADAEAALSDLTREKDEVSRAFSDLRRDISKLEHRESQLVRDGDRLRAAQAKAADALSSSVADGKLLSAQVEDAAKRIDETGARLAEATERLTAAEAALQRAADADEACKARAAKAFAAVDEQRRALETRRLEVSRLAAQVAGLEEGERTARAANKALAWAVEQGEGLGSRGLLLDALEIPEDATEIVEALLADAVDALLVASADAAGAAAASVAASGEEGSVSLLTLAGGKAGGNAPAEAGPLAAALPASAPGVPLMDVLGCKDEFRDAAFRLLGDVLLCDTLEQARKCVAALEGSKAARQVPWRVASKDGYLASSSGMHRFVRRARGSVGALERHRELDQARRQLERARALQAEGEAALEQTERQLREEQKAGLELTSARAQAQGERDSLSDRVAQAERELSALREQAAELARRRDRNEALLQQMKPDSERIAAELESSSAELASVRASLGDLREQLQPLRRRSGALNERHTEARLEVGKLAEREAYARRMVEGHAGDIARLERQVARMRHVASGSVRIGEVDAIVGALSLVRETVTGHISAIERQADEFRSGASAIHIQADEKRREALALRGEVDAANTRLSDTRVEKGRLEVQVEAAIATIKEECGASLEAALERPPLSDRLRCEEQAASLRRRIANLGPINPDAAREYAELKERYDYLQGQVADIAAARRALERIVGIIDERMKDDFANTFQAVDSNFRRIFAQLFPGGSAQLSLVEGETPDQLGVEVSAQPRGKRISKMSLMSGGEKSLTALALLFAVYATRPTPFYILDEVEAALDDTNLRRLCSYLDDMRGRTQLIMITHQRRTMEMSDVLYGVSMQSDGVTRVISQKLDRTTVVQEG